ncbi:MAG: glycosyltransferase family 10 [Spirochaetales bacterium]|nr:glycosyltransferase family 10 [Spirochaetales bacterium]
MTKNPIKILRITKQRLLHPEPPMENGGALYHEIYGKFYVPKYNLSAPFDQTPADIFNKKGERLECIYLRDDLSAHSPYLKSDRVFFDRYNFGLKKHFYSQVNLFEQCGKPDKKYAYFPESETVLPETYDIFDKNKGLEKDFDYIFTFSEKILDKIEKARFVPFCTGPWFGSEKYGGTMTTDAYKYKTKNISIMASRQNISEYHKLRIAIAKKCKEQNLADTYGTFDGGPFLDKIDHVFAPYRYSIIIENDVKAYYFTEKITSCFAAMTIPIYLGAEKIGKFFNEDGIIKISPSDFDRLEDVLKQCTEENYLSRLDAVKDNYNRVLKHLNVFDNFIYDKYIKD